MIKLLKIEMRRLFQNKAFYLSLAIGFGLCIWLLLTQLQEVRELNEAIKEYGTEKLGLYYPRSLYNSFIGLDYAYLPSTILYTIFPLLVTLPHAISYYRDKKSGYIKNILLKTDRKDYYFAKYLSVFASGFITTLVILLFSLWISAMAFPALNPEVATSTYCPFLKTQMMVELFYSHPLIYVLIYILIDAVFFGIVSTIALGISIFAGNILLVFSGGMILYLVVEYLMEITNKWDFSPFLFLKPTQLNCNAKPQIIFIEAIGIILFVSIPFFLKERKKDVF